MSDLKVIQFDPTGPAGRGLERWEDFPADEIASGKPVQHGFNYFTDPAGVLTAGIWECTPFTGTFGPYSVNEFMYLLEGSVALVDETGREQVVRKGEAFLIPKGLPCAWKQTERVRKFYVIFDDPSGLNPKDSSSLKMLRFEARGPGGKMETMALPDLSIFEGKPPVQHVHNYFTDLTGQMIAGVWDCTPMIRKMMVFPRNELMCLLEGSVTIVEGNGRAETFRAGDSFLVPQGLECEWRSTEYVRKYYCIYEPKKAAARAAAAE